MSSSVATTDPRQTASRPLVRRGSDHLFFSGMALVSAVTVLAGFGRTYYLKGVFGTPPLSPLLHAHGLVFTSWVALFIAQTSLVAARRTDIHRRLGIAGALLAILMLVLGLAAAIDSGRRGFAPPGGLPPLVFLVIPVTAVLVFAVIVALALYYRRRPETHKRLMLLAMISLLTPAIARLPVLRGGGPPVALGLTDLLVLVCFVYDWRTRGRIHPAFLWGGLLFIASQPLRIAFGHSGAWLAFAAWLIR